MRSVINVVLRRLNKYGGTNMNIDEQKEIIRRCRGKPTRVVDGTRIYEYEGKIVTTVALSDLKCR